LWRRHEVWHSINMVANAVHVKRTWSLQILA
jgi:hypothetical protein